KVLWETVTQPRSMKETKAHGDTLEHLAAYLLLLIPGLVPRINVIPETNDMQHDLVISNLRQSSSLEAELFGRNFLVECKNWKKKIGPSEIGYFLYRMRLTHTTFGIMFARSGIAGGIKGQAAFAQNLCQRAFHEDGSICILIQE